LNYEPERAYRLYQTHIGLISEGYDKLVNKFTLLSTSCLSRKQREDCGLKIITTKSPTFFIVNDDVMDLSERLFRDLNTLSALIFEIWHQFINLLCEAPAAIIKVLKDEYIKSLKEIWGECMFRDVHHSDTFNVWHDENIKTLHQQIADQRETFLPAAGKSKIKINLLTKTFLSQFCIEPVIFE
jgi:hypothetical protein